MELSREDLKSLVMFTRNSDSEKTTKVYCASKGSKFLVRFSILHAQNHLTFSQLFAIVLLVFVPSFFRMD